MLRATTSSGNPRTRLHRSPELQPRQVSLSQEGNSQHVRADRSDAVTQGNMMALQIYIRSIASQRAEHMYAKLVQDGLRRLKQLRRIIVACRYHDLQPGICTQKPAIAA